MFDDINLVTISGNLTKDPEVKQMPNGTSVLNCSLASNRSYKSGDEWKKIVTFVNFEVFGKYAEVLGKNLTKGTGVTIVGSLNINTVKSDDGTSKTYTKVKVDSLKMNKKAGSGSSDINDNPPGDGEAVPF